MTPEKARELVANEIPQHAVVGPTVGLFRDAAVPKPMVEVISPSLRDLKRRYFSDNASATPVIEPDSPDTGIVQVKAADGKPSRTQAVLFSKGKIIGRQG